MLLQKSGTSLPQLMNTSGFHRNVDEGNKSFKTSGKQYYSRYCQLSLLCLSMELGEPEYKEKNDKKTKLKGGLGWIR